MGAETTIGIQKSTRQKLEKMKIHERETCDDILNRLINEIQSIKKLGKNKRLDV